MPVELKPVRSSAISHLGHDPDKSEMHVRYRSGRTYIMEKVSAAQYDALCNARSIGAHLNQHFNGYRIRAVKHAG